LENASLQKTQEERAMKLTGGIKVVPVEKAPILEHKNKELLGSERQNIRVAKS
jgi:hypothetical protein